MVCPIMDVIPIIHCGDEHEYRLKNFIPLNLTGMGLDLLLDRKYPPGREPFLTLEQQQELKQTILTHTPAELGWDIASSWNTRILQSYIREHYEVDMSREGIRKLLHRMRLSWTRPTYTLAKGDAEQQQAFEKQMDLIKKN